MEIANLIAYSVLVVWFFYSLFQIIKLFRTKNLNSINLYIYDLIPSVFATIGILGTFLGIYFGLKEFDVKNINESIPNLLEGLKTAFLTSIVGVSLSMISSYVSKIVLKRAELNLPPKPTDELDALQEISKVLKEFKEQNHLDADTLNNSLVGENDHSISVQIIKLKNQLIDLEKKYDVHVRILESIKGSLGGDDDTSLLTQFQKLRSEQNDNIKLILNSMSENNKLLSAKFDEFSHLLARNNTEALVEVMKRATDEFNKQMSAIVERLVQENFKELNDSVQRMNQWQKENKEMIKSLTDQFIKVSKEFEISSVAIKEITENTKKLTDENSHLSKLIQELQKVMIEDKKFQEIVNKLTLTINTLKENTDEFDKTTQKLNEWVKNQMNFTESVAVLIEKMDELKTDINQSFWNRIENELNKGVNIISKANQQLAIDIEKINEHFYDQLNNTLKSLDELMTSYLENRRN